MAHGEVKHDYHLVNPSPWPLLGSLFVAVLALGFVTYTKGLFGLEPGTMWLMGLGLLGVMYVMFGWWRDVVKESRAGDHTPVVQIGLRYGMILFILSEVMFFVAWFWGFFEFAIFWPERTATWDAANPIYADSLSRFADWPPAGVETFDPFHLPLINTLVLLLSGTTVTWAHHALQHGDRSGARNGLILTVVLGMLFTALQVLEYSHAGFTYDGTLYGSAFYMATGFHGAHVVIGTIFLAVCLIRLMVGGFTPQKHFGFEAAAWYWHFVDVVWLFLFAFVYVVPYLVLG
ncbi:MAG: PEP-CTERM sorting domain-containing protein [Alphaproteobacteria bacterium]|jgi:cytochrome c oxidase subunit 3|nr:PEP-CTERM sorting domain-containing protein [Alphaproteobacteria bacterium]